MQPVNPVVGLSLGLVLCSFQAYGPATAATATGAINVTATVQATCTISTTDLAFGSYTGNQILSTGTVVVTCSNTTPYNITANTGLHHQQGSSTYDDYMIGPSGALLLYNFYQDSAHTTIWGSTIGTDSKSGTGNGNPQTYTANGVLWAGNSQPRAVFTPGVYTDTLTFTISY